ncbi:MAG: hypothetical protein K1X65_19975 [Caldilineales bacterium]|nr:hypothetical protein [Caldilineales bacterium]MCW5857080.1 hypothetical protein [Caldilineales bacterium]
MEESSRSDIRRLLKIFGVQADEAVIAHLTRHPVGAPLRLRLRLEDLTDYEGDPAVPPLQLEIEGEVRRD